MLALSAVLWVLVLVWICVGRKRETRELGGGPAIDEVLGAVAEKLEGRVLSRFFGLDSGRPERDYRTDIYVVGGLALTLMATATFGADDGAWVRNTWPAAVLVLLPFVCGFRPKASRHCSEQSDESG
jgi:hypothetical protein